MKVLTSKSALDAAVQVATIGVAGGSDESALHSHYLFRVTTDRVELLATNGKRTFASAIVSGAVVEGDPVNFTIAAWRLRQWLQVVPDGDITLKYDNAVVKATFGKNTTKFSSVDPSAFPFWDSILSEAEVTVKVPSDRLFGALSYIKPFVSDQETRTPQIVSTECRDSTLFATDTVGVALVHLPGFDAAKFRLHGADIPAALSFLGSKSTGDVELLEHERCLILRREDGSLVGISKWTFDFPKLKIDRESPPKCTFTVNVASLQFALKFLSVSAVKNDDAVTFSFEGNQLKLSAVSAAGDSESMAVDTTATESLAAFADAGYSSFTLSRKYLEPLIASLGGETLTFGVGWTAKNGFVQFRQGRGGDDFVSIVMWMKR